MSCNNTIAVMQPYLFPYFGYFKMISLADIFIVYDNVKYIKRGFVNRNKILINGEPKFFNFGINKEDKHNNIDTVRFRDFNESRTKFLNQVYYSYKRTPYFEDTFSTLESILNIEYDYIVQLNVKSLVKLSSKLKLDTSFELSSELQINKFEHLDKQQKLDKIIEKTSASQIIMPPNSLNLYKDWLPIKNSKKTTLELKSIHYKQFSNTFVPHLSIIDVLMFNGFEKTSKLLKA
jgi:hypothetical protein